MSYVVFCDICGKEINQNGLIQATLGIEDKGLQGCKPCRDKVNNFIAGLQKERESIVWRVETEPQELFKNISSEEESTVEVVD